MGTIKLGVVKCLCLSPLPTCLLPLLIEHVVMLFSQPNPQPPLEDSDGM